MALPGADAPEWNVLQIPSDGCLTLAGGGDMFFLLSCFLAGEMSCVLSCVLAVLCVVWEGDMGYMNPVP